VAHFDDAEKELAWRVILASRPQHDPGHDPDCPGLTDHLVAYRDSCPTCRRWLADLLREDRRADAGERRPKA